MEKEDDLSTPPLLPSSSGSGRDVLELPRIRDTERIECAADVALFLTTSNVTSREMKCTHNEARGTTTDDEQDGERIPEEEAICRICSKEIERDVSTKSRRSPSYRTTSNGPSQEMRSTHGEFVLVCRRKAVCGTTTTNDGKRPKKQKKETTTNDEDERRIPKEEAICRICFKEFEKVNAFQVDCQCPATLIHENCATVWFRQKRNNKCDDCGQELKKTPVDLIPTKDSAPDPKKKDSSAPDRKKKDSAPDSKKKDSAPDRKKKDSAPDPKKKDSAPDPKKGLCSWNCFTKG